MDMLSKCRELEAEVKELQDQVAKLEKEREKDQLEYHLLQAEHHSNQHMLKTYESKIKENICKYNALLQMNTKLELEINKLEALLEHPKANCCSTKDSEIIKDNLVAIKLEQEDVEANTTEVSQEIEVIEATIRTLQQQYQEFLLECKEKQNARENYLKLKKEEFPSNY